MKEKKLKLVTVVLAIIAICLVSFIGVYIPNKNILENKVKEYKFSKDLEGYRELVFKVSDATEVTDSNGKVVGNTDSYSDETIANNSYVKTENKINSEESLNKENYKKAKKIIEERLNGLKVQDYTIAQNEEDGTIYLQIPEDSQTDHTVSNILQVGKLELKDSEDESKMFLTNDNLKKASAGYNYTESGTTVYLTMKFDKEAKITLSEISNGEYKTVQNKENEENNNETNVEAETSEDENTTQESSEETSEGEEKTENIQKKIILSIDENEMINSSFTDPIENGTISLSMGQASTDSKKVSESLQSAATIATILNSGSMPLTYKIDENTYVQTDISKENVKKAIYAVTIVFIISLMYLIIKFKGRGLIASIASVGFIAISLLVVRYTNVVISIESIIAEVLVILINYIITLKLLKVNEPDEELRIKENAKVFKDMIIKLIPILMIAIVFTFIEFTKISAFGMVMFWGVILNIIYNFTITKSIIDIDK